jgi:hypothetical protein
MLPLLPPCPPSLSSTSLPPPPNPRPPNPRPPPHPPPTHLEDVSDASTPHEFRQGQVLAVALQQGTKALRIATQQLQQRSTPACVFGVGGCAAGTCESW